MEQQPMIAEEKNAIIGRLRDLIGILSVERFRYKGNEDEINQTIHYLENEKTRLAALDEQTPPPRAYGAFRIVSSLPRALEELLIDWKEIPDFRAKVIETSNLSNQYADRHRQSP